MDNFEDDILKQTEYMLAQEREEERRLGVVQRQISEIREFKMGRRSMKTTDLLNHLYYRTKNGDLSRPEYHEIMIQLHGRYMSDHILDNFQRLTEYFLTADTEDTLDLVYDYFEKGFPPTVELTE